MVRATGRKRGSRVVRYIYVYIYRYNIYLAFRTVSPRSILSARPEVAENVRDLEWPNRGVDDQFASSKREAMSPAETAMTSPRKERHRLVLPVASAQVSFG